MSNFNLDNAGSGFSLDGEDDLNNLLSEANSLGEPNEEDNTAIYFQGVETDEVPESSPVAPVFIQPESDPDPELVEVPQNAFEPVDEPHIFVETPSYPDMEMNEPEPDPEPEKIEIVEEFHPEPIPAYQDNDDFFTTPKVEPDLKSEPQPEPEIESTFIPEPEVSFIPETEQIPEPVAVVDNSSRNSYTPPKMKVPSMADDLEKVHQVIRIIDAYRNLNSEEKIVAAQFITAGEEVSDEGEFIVKTLNVDPMLTVTMRSLREAKQLDDVERSFYVIELEDDVLYSLGSLVGVFTEQDLDPKAGRGKYARQLVRDIERLDSKAMNFVTATESVLDAADRKD